MANVELWLVTLVFMIDERVLTLPRRLLMADLAGGLFSLTGLAGWRLTGLGVAERGCVTKLVSESAGVSTVSAWHGSVC